MAVTPKRKAEIIAQLEEIMGRKLMARPKVVVKDNEIVRDAEPHVSKADPNYPNSDRGVVTVRRSDFVTINMALWEAQQEMKREDRLRRRLIDPARMGHWDD